LDEAGDDKGMVEIIWPERGLIGWNFVVPEYQGQGIGKAQIHEILHTFRIKGIRKACETTTGDLCTTP
jgi:GNAT superfamily N-acetyltransferase